MMKKFIFRLSPEITRLLHALCDPNLPRYEFLSNKTTFWNRLGVWEARVLSDRSIIDFCHENMARLVWFQITPEISSISKRQNGCSSNLIKTYYFIKMLPEMSAYIIFQWSSLKLFNNWLNEKRYSCLKKLWVKAVVIFYEIFSGFRNFLSC